MPKSEVVRSARGRELVQKLPPDVYGPETIMRYFKRYDEDGQDYTYVAVKTGDGKWFQDGDYLTWKQLLLRIDDDNMYDITSGAIQIAVDWEPHKTEGE